MFDPPESPQELSWRAAALEGRTLGAIARVLDVAVPDDPVRAKGWIGQLIEVALGASAGNRPVPDFVRLGVELKTIPVDDRGRPKESTFVCSAALDGGEPDWESSRVRHKLASVLWVPVESAGPIADRRVGAARLWSPSPGEEDVLRRDWEELTGILRLGDLQRISARHGEALQLRPKAADAGRTTWALDADAEWVRQQPVGFYLRTRFTARIVAPADPPGDVGSS